MEATAKDAKNKEKVKEETTEAKPDAEKKKQQQAHLEDLLAKRAE